MQKDEIVTVITAVELTEAEKDKMEQRLRKISGHNIFSIKYEVDPGIIAGIVIKTRAKIIDNSVNQKLQDLRIKLIAYGSEQVK